MKTYKILFLLPVLLFSFCSSKPTENTNSSTVAAEANGQAFKIEGKISNYPSQQQIILQELTTQGGVQPIDTATIDAEGNFVFEGFVREKTFAMLNLGQYRNVFFVIDTTSKIKVTIDAGATLTYQVSNSPASEDIQKMANLNADYNQKIMDLSVKAQSDPAMSVENRAAIEGQINNLVAELKEKLSQQLKALKSPLAQIFSIEMLQVAADKATEESIMAAISKQPSNKWYSFYLPKAQARIKTAIGSVAPDITLSTPEGAVLSLSSLKGKYVLVDFWASWCRPCRAENPNVVRMYNLYKEKGFEILGVSLDKSADAWKQAIMADNLTWKHISDLGGWQSSAAQLYNITSIPQTLLLDKNGVIIGKNLRGAELETKLKNIFN